MESEQGNLFRGVMLVDDNNIDNFIHEKMIKKKGFANTVYVHSSVLSGLEFLKNMEAIQSFFPDMIPKIIFLDINLPMLDGFQFLDEFEKFSQELKSKIKIVILTSSIDPSDLKRSKTYESVVDYCYKPLSENHLNDLSTSEIADYSFKEP
jgi:CheY-like chemotaxis protein